MPRMSGEEVRRVQRADPLLASIPTVVVSAADRLADRIAALMPSGFLPKPIKLGDLLRTVERFCGARR
jgi:CheY-like chemotaxis protein